MLSDNQVMLEDERKKVADRLRQAMREEGITNTALAEAVGVSVQAVGFWLKTGKVSRNRLPQIAKTVHKTVDWLLTGKKPEERLEPGPKVGIQKKIPVVGTAQLGDNGFWHEIEYPVGHGDGYIEAPTADPNAYALRVKGHSMHPAIRDGWFVVVEPNREPIPGEYVMVRLKDGRSMVKEFLWMRDGQVNVQSINEDRRYTFDLQEVDKIHYVGPIVPPSKRRFE